VRAGYAALIYLACLVIPVIKPWDGMGLYIMLAALRPHEITYGLELAGGRYSIVTLALVMVGWALRFKQMTPRWGTFHWLLIAFGIQLFISRAYAINDVAAKYQFDLLFIPVVVSMIMVQVIRTEEHVSRVMWFLTVGLGFLGYWAFWKSHFTDYYDLEADGEIMGPGGSLVDRNDFGLGLAATFPLLFFVGLTAKSKLVRIIAIVSMGPTAITALETGSRGAFLATGAVDFYMLYKMHHKRWVIGMAFVGVLVGLSVIPPNFWDRYTSIHQAAAEDDSAQGRIVSWNAAIQMARHKPLTGVGLGCFTVDYFRYAPDSNTPLVAHSSFFQILGTAGIPGAILWVALIVRFWQVTTRLERKLRRARLKGSRLHYLVLALRSSHIAYVIAGMFLSQEDFEFFYFELGILAALDVVVTKRVAERRKELGELDKGSQPVEEPEAGPVRPVAAEPWPPAPPTGSQGPPGYGPASM